MVGAICFLCCLPINAGDVCNFWVNSPASSEDEEKKAARREYIAEASLVHDACNTVAMSIINNLIIGGQ